MNLRNDKIIAEKVCIGEKVKEYEDLIIDDIYTASKKLANVFESNHLERSSYKTKKGLEIEVTEDVQDAAVWLLKLANKSCCNYEGKAPLIHYLRSILYSNDFTKKNYIRYKTKISGNIPKPIQKLSKIHQDIFLLLRQEKDPETIMYQLKIDNEIIYKKHFQDIANALSKSGLLDLIIKNQFVAISPTDEIDDEGKTFVVSDQDLSVDESFNFNLEKEVLYSLLNNIDDRERRLLILYWGYNLKPDEMIELFHSSPNYDTYLNYFSISNSKDISKAIDNLQYKLFKNWNEKREKKINKALFRMILKNYIIYMNAERVEDS